MTIEADITATLNNNATLNALVSGRNYKGRITDNPVFPYTFTQRISTVPVNTLGGSNGLINARYQIDCYATSYSGAWALARAVRGAMSGATLYKSLWLDDSDLNFDPDISGYRIVADFSVWFTE